MMSEKAEWLPSFFTYNRENNHTKIGKKLSEKRHSPKTKSRARLEPTPLEDDFPRRRLK
jgi:hypothetical protein